jgi:hypothetical protein
MGGGGSIIIQLINYYRLIPYTLLVGPMVQFISTSSTMTHQQARGLLARKL